MKGACAALATAAVLGWSVPDARADDDDGGVAGAFPDPRPALVFAALELLVPDVRVEFGEGVEGSADAVLSWPIYLTHRHLRERWTLSPFVEPQWAPATEESRLLIGARLSWLAVDPGGLLVETAGRLASESDTGFVVGGGVILLGTTDLRTLLPSLSVVYRYSYFPGGGPRHDVTLDVTCLSLSSLLELL
jgi:hypothetical protein